MGEYFVKEESLTAVADAVRAKTGATDELAFPDGFVEAIEGISAGGDLSYDDFWDAIQDYGNRREYQYAFGMGNFADFFNNSKPKYPITCSGSSSAGTYVFANGKQIETIDADIVCTDTYIDRMFSGCTSLKTVKSLKLTGVSRYTGAFAGCRSLTTITITEGSSIDASVGFADSSELTAASAESIVNALNPAKSGTLTLNANVWSRLDTEKPRSDGKTWKQYVESLGWTAA